MEALHGVRMYNQLSNYLSQDSFMVHDFKRIIECRSHITQADLELFLSKERAKHCLETLDFDNNGTVSNSHLPS